MSTKPEAHATKWTVVVGVDRPTVRLFAIKPRPRPSATSVCSMGGKRTCYPRSRPQAARHPLLEAECENCLRELDKAKAELARREALRPKTLGPDERSRLLALGTDLLKVCQAPTTLPRDKKELLRTVPEEVIITVDKEHRRAHLTLRWRGGALSEIDIDLPPRRSAPIRTAEDTVALVRRLAAHYPDAVIAGILNRQERRTAFGHRFTANLVSGLRRHWNIPNFKRPSTAPEGELVNIRQAAAALGVAASTVHRWFNEGIIAGEQLTPGAPWRIRLTEHLRALVAEEAPEGLRPVYRAVPSWPVPRVRA